MPDFLLNMGVEVPFTLMLLALLGLRAKVKPRASVLIKAPIAHVFHLIDLYDGKIQNWGRTTVSAHAVEPTSQIYRMSYSTNLSTGSVQASQALFRIVDRQENARIEIDREGIATKSKNNELLKIVHEVREEAGGTRLTSTYHWGPRSLIAQLLARADLWGGTYRLKGLAETGVPDERTHAIISGLVALITGIVTFVTFGLFVGYVVAAFLILALIVHEFGHLLAFRLIGQPWGRLIFLPFLGALAVPRLAYQSQSQAVFSALMGPGFSIVLMIACAIPLLFDTSGSSLFKILGFVTVGLNLFNLLPVEPLDGGVALRSVLARLIGKNANWGLMAIGAAIAGLGFYFAQVVLIIFGGIAILANRKNRAIDAGLKPLTSWQLSMSALGYMAILATHLGFLVFFWTSIARLQT